MPEGGESAELNTVQVLSGSTFMLSDPRGDVLGGSLAGLFFEDTRFLSRFLLTVNGERMSLLTSGTTEYDRAAFFLVNPDLDGLEGRSFSIYRLRSIADGMGEGLQIVSHVDRPIDIEVRLACGVDFADLFEVKRQTFTKMGRTETAHDGGYLLYRYEHLGFRAASQISASEPTIGPPGSPGEPTGSRARTEGDDLVFDVHLERRKGWKTRILVQMTSGTRELSPPEELDHAGTMFVQQWKLKSPELQAWEDAVPNIDAELDLVNSVYDRSIKDLAALRLHADVEGNEFSLPAAGLPWFMAIFGRDTLITSYQSLMVGPDLARGALYRLADLQGTEVNDFKDEEPGKILHEIRYGELTMLGEMPHRPYYGTSDATPLWLILLSEYWRFTGDDSAVKELRSNAERALEWIDRHGDRDGDGYIEYKTRSTRGLRNQGWKDSWNSVCFSDGRVAGGGQDIDWTDYPAVAMCEFQGYAYDAKMRIAELAEKVWGDPELAARLREEASSLFDRFNEDFWTDARGGYYIEALMGDPGSKEKADAMTSNMGHLLWSGIVPPQRASILVKHFFSDGMRSGWGFRTMSADEPAYNPVMYHNGTVWPHDNSLICAGLHRYGFRGQVNDVVLSMFQAAEYTEFRLPEVFAGYARADSGFPVRYPTASSPQAWATAAPFLWLRLVLGLDVKDGDLVVDPFVPPQFGTLKFKDPGIHALGRRWDVTATGMTAKVSEAEAPVGPQPEGAR
jgi:glycogen debranching enzyme